MANTWWMSTLGSDANSGASYEQAKLTIAGIMGIAGLVTGDTINIVNDGTYTWPQSATPTNVKAGTKGTNFTTGYGLLIRGTNPDGKAEGVKFKPTGGVGVRSWLQLVANTGFVIIRNISADASGFESDVNVFDFIEWDDTGSPDPGPVQTEGGGLIGAGLGSFADGVRRFIQINTGASVSGFHYFTAYGGYFQNAPAPIGGNGISTKVMDHCIFYLDNDGAIGAFYTQTLSASSASASLTFKNCTIYESIGGGVVLAPLNFNAGSGANYGTVVVHSNLCYYEGTSSSIQVRFMGDASAPAGETGSATIGNNVFVGGPSVTSGEKHTAGWYQNQWDPDQNDATGIDPYATDVEEFGQYEAQVFAHPTQTYPWDPLGNGVQTILPKDLRPIKYLTVGLGGTVPGALPGFVPSPAELISIEPEYVVETLSWLTSVVTANNGSDEQRMSLRFQPRRRLELGLIIEDEAARRAEYRRLYASAGRLRVPLFQYATNLTQGSIVGATKIFFNPARTDIRDNEIVVVIRKSTGEAFQIEITTVVSDGANTALPLAQALVASDYVVPSLEGYLDTQPSLGMTTVSGVLNVGVLVSAARVSFPRPGSTAVITAFDGLNVLDKRPLVQGEVQEQFSRSPDIFDNDTGLYQEQLHWLHQFIGGMRAFLIQRLMVPGDMDYWRDFLHSIRGMREPFLLPTFRDDLVLSSNPGAGATTMDVLTTDYSTRYFPYDTYKRLRLEAPNSEVIYRKVTSVLVISPTVQRLTIAALPGTSQWSGSFRIGYLNRVRLGTDEVRLAHQAMDTLLELSVRTTDT